MPKSWYDRHTVNKIEDSELKSFYRKVVADKKPYFMRYIYPSLMKQYNTYIKKSNRNSLCEFNMTIDELQCLPESELTDRQKEFIRYYKIKMPVGIGDCVMNKICRRFESEFDGYLSNYSSHVNFDHSFMKSGTKYTEAQFYSIQRLYNEYNQKMRNYAIFAANERVDNISKAENLDMINREFRKKCELICPDSSVLCEIIIDMCYKRNSTKRFAWGICGNTIIRNLLEKNNGIISFPTINKDGEIYYCGERYTLKRTKIEVNE